MDLNNYLELSFSSVKGLLNGNLFYYIRFKNIEIRRILHGQNVPWDFKKIVKSSIVKNKIITSLWLGTISKP